MTFAFSRRRRARKVGPGGLVRLALVLLCWGALGRYPAAHAQGFKKLPEATQVIPLNAPVPAELFRVESEATMRQRLRAEASRAKASPPIFPAAPAPQPPFGGRVWPAMATYAEPSYVCYGRLFFQQINSERYGWDLGAIQPLLSIGKFYLDVATLPYQLATGPFRTYECSAGYCLPGSPVPLLLYPPEWSATGTVAEAAVLAALFLAFP